MRTAVDTSKGTVYRKYSKNMNWDCECGGEFFIDGEGATRTDLLLESTYKPLTEVAEPEEKTVNSLKIPDTEKIKQLRAKKAEKERIYRDWETDRKSTRLNSSHITRSRMPSSA